MSNGFYVELSTMSDAVTGSCTLVTLRLPDDTTQKVIIDCGSFLEKETKYKNTTFHFDPKELDACVITHGHIDHIGRLPLLVKNGYNRKIDCTKVTGNIIPISLDDNFKIMCRESKNGNGYSNGNGNGNGNGYLRLYEEEHVEKVNKNLRIHNYEHKIAITPNINLYFLQNGHIFGAAVVYLRCFCKGYDDINIIFTGDYKKDNSFFKIGKRLPFGLRNKRVNIVTETTYGASLTDDINHNFFDEICKAVEKGNKILLPTFSLGRTQEVLLFLKRMQELGYIPNYYTIYYDGKLGRKYLELASKNMLGIKRNKDFLPKNFQIIGEDKDKKTKDERQELIDSNKPAIIVASSGNGSYGPSNAYLRQMIENENVTIIFTGYCTEGSVGRMLIDSKYDEELELFGEIFIKKANVLFTSQFTAHAHADELMEFIKKFNNLGSVILTHGEEFDKKVFSKILEEDLDINPLKIGTLGSDFIIRIDTWGLINEGEKATTESNDYLTDLI